ncbi:Ig-like domain-containing protein [Myxococcota bacterium]|nr:Ig-like domain-containing protein [Myxococcota bacterium]
MKRLFFLLIIGLFIMACDDDTNNANNNTSEVSLENSSITFTAGTYSVEREAFVSQVTVTVLDAGGSPLAQKAVAPASTMTGGTFDPETVVTDSDGAASFVFVTNHIGVATFSAQVGTTEQTPLQDPVTLDSTEEATFEFSVNVIPLSATYSPSSGDFSLRATFSDASGVIAGATGTVADASTLITFSPGTLTTDGNGRAIFSALTSDAGVATLIFTLTGIEESVETSFHFAGPVITGLNSNSQYYHPLGFHTGRVSLMALNMLDRDTIDLSNPIKGEVHSETTCPCPGPVEYELELPIAPDSSLLTTDATLGIDYGIFIVTIYDDLDGNYVWDEGEPFIGVTLADTVLHFAAPHETSDFEYPGWSIVNQVGSDPEFADWESEKDSVDVLVTRAPLYEPTIIGTVATELTSDTRVLWAAVDVNAVPGGFTPVEPLMMSQVSTIMATASNYHILGDFDAPAAGWTAPLPDLTAELDQTTTSAWKFTMDSGAGLGDVEGILLVGVLYHDADSSGSFTAGDALIGMAHEVTDHSSVFLYVLDYPNYGMFIDNMSYWFHSGYNHLLTPRRIEISTVDLSGGTYTVNLATGIGATGTTGNFAILAAGSAFTSTPVATGTFTIDNTLSDTVTINTTDCTGCNLIAPGTQFVILPEPAINPGDFSFTDLRTVLLID